jgi:Ras-related protein Rab-7A
MPATIQYVSGHFSTGFRSTIGTDFITKTLPHHSKPDESVTL